MQLYLISSHMSVCVPQFVFQSTLLFNLFISFNLFYFLFVFFSSYSFLILSLFLLKSHKNSNILLRAKHPSFLIAFSLSLCLSVSLSVSLPHSRFSSYVFLVSVPAGNLFQLSHKQICSVVTKPSTLLVHQKSKGNKKVSCNDVNCAATYTTRLSNLIKKTKKTVFEM